MATSTPWGVAATTAIRSPSEGGQLAQALRAQAVRGQMLALREDWRSSSIDPASSGRADRSVKSLTEGAFISAHRALLRPTSVRYRRSPLLPFAAGSRLRIERRPAERRSGTDFACWGTSYAESADEALATFLSSSMRTAMSWTFPEIIARLRRGRSRLALALWSSRPAANSLTITRSISLREDTGTSDPTIVATAFPLPAATGSDE